MAHKFIHEEIYRGDQALAKLQEASVSLCGAGALGSQIADNLSRQGVGSMRVIDFDRIEEHNVGTQLYGIADVGAKKVDVLRHHLFRSVGVEIDVFAKRLETGNARRLLKQADLVIDTFDNSASRRCVQEHCRKESVPCIHIGLNADYAEVIWDEEYRVPNDVGGDVCEYPLARNLVLAAVALGSEAIIRYLIDGTQDSLALTLGDFSITRPESVA